jgi:hypothetical protein
MASGLSINALPQSLTQNENSLSSNNVLGKENSLGQANSTSNRAFGRELTNFHKAESLVIEAPKSYVK